MRSWRCTNAGVVALEDWQGMRQGLYPNGPGSAPRERNYRVCRLSRARHRDRLPAIATRDQQAALTMNLRSFEKVNLRAASIRSNESSESLMLFMRTYQF